MASILDFTVGPAARFIEQLRSILLLDPVDFDRMIGEVTRTRKIRTAGDLAGLLLDRGVLTQFQADRLLDGQAQSLVLGPYYLQDVIGSGSLGPVYRAVRRDGGTFVVKLIPQRNMWKMVKARKYVRVFEGASHPSVASFTDLGTAGGYHYLVWGFVEGESLRRKVERDGPLPPGTAAYYAAQVADGLAACHDQGLTHGLVGPGNVLIGPDGQARVTDTGIGALLAENTAGNLLTTHGQASLLTCGLDCACPEGILDPDRRGPAGDQYSLGCTLYYLLTGQFPFTGVVVERIQAHQNEAPVPVGELNPDVPPGLADVVERLMQKDPADRYDSMVEVIDALVEFAKRPAPARRPAPPQRVTVTTPTPPPSNGLELDALPEVRPSRPADEGSFATLSPPPAKNRYAPMLAAVLLAGAALGAVVGWMVK